MKVPSFSPTVILILQKILFTLFLVAAGVLCNLHAQTVRGTVRDGITYLPVPGAIVEIWAQRSGSGEQVTVTDSTGEFTITDLKAGIYRCMATAPGYMPVTTNTFLAGAGKQSVMDIFLLPTGTNLPAVTITASLPANPAGAVPLSREQTFRYPAVFFDPARLATVYPGIIQTDDQANGLSVRGHAPWATRWRLGGVAVTNPNHLPNAGTIADRPVLSGGGILLFSAQLLDQTTLLNGAFPAGYGDALGGIFDLNLRRGNSRQAEYTFQAGLIGLDAAAEGPLGPTNRHSYIVNYRYSTVGLLTQLGVPFGDEAISFQDLSVHLSFTGKKGVETAVFAMGGSSVNDFSRKSVPASYKDLFNIVFRSRTGLVGATLQIPFAKSTVKFSAVWSAQQNERRETGPQLTRDDQYEQNMGLSAVWSGRLSAGTALTAGIMSQHLVFELTRQRDSLPLTGGSTVANLFQPFISALFTSRNGRHTTQAGLHTAVWVHNATAEILPEPRLRYTFSWHHRHRLTVAAAVTGQAPPLWLFVPVEGKSYSGGLITSRQVTAAYRLQMENNWSFQGEAYLQMVGQAPVSDSVGSVLNAYEPVFFTRHTAEGKGRYTGLEFSAERSVANGWFLLGNITLYRVTLSDSGSSRQNGRWDGRWMTQATAGREWSRETPEGHTRTWGFNARILVRGGYREQPIDVVASREMATTVYETEGGFSRRLPVYSRADFRVYWRRSITNRRNSILAMDFQNAAFRQNVAYHYYDPFTERVETRYQLGLTPNISWRLEF